MRILVTFLFLTIFQFIIAQNKFYNIDKHALNTNSSRFNSVESVCKYLVKPAKNDLEKVRSFYVWITNNITYDTKAFFSNSQKQYTPEEVLKRKKAVCEGYANLFKAMCDMENIPCVIISGYSKGYGYNAKKPLKSKDHAWNAVKIDDTWQLIDATWGSGYLNSKGRFVKHFSNNFFLSNPETFIYKHLPADPMWQLLETPITINEFRYDSTKIKNYILSADKSYNYKDSIAAFEKLTKEERELKTAINQYNFNNKLSSAVGFAYMNRAFTLFNNLMENKELPLEEAYSKQISILKLYEKALYYFKINNDEVSLQARKVCKSNISSCKQNIETYKKRMQYEHQNR